MAPKELKALVDVKMTPGFSIVAKVYAWILSVLVGKKIIEVNQAVKSFKKFCKNSLRYRINKGAWRLM